MWSVWSDSLKFDALWPSMRLVSTRSTLLMLLLFDTPTQFFIGLLLSVVGIVEIYHHNGGPIQFFQFCQLLLYACCCYVIRGSKLLSPFFVRSINEMLKIGVQDRHNFACRQISKGDLVKAKASFQGGWVNWILSSREETHLKSKLHLPRHRIKFLKQFDFAKQN